MVWLSVRDKEELLYTCSFAGICIYALKAQTQIFTPIKIYSGAEIIEYSKMLHNIKHTIIGFHF